VLSTKARLCDYCQSEEGKPRPIGRYEVVLKEVFVDGNTLYACQSCIVNNRDSFTSNQVDVIDKPRVDLNPSLLQKLKEKLSRS